MSLSDTEEQSCPLCLEELDITDRNFRPCQCGYQMCRFCWHHVKENLNGKCPACRKVYEPENYSFTPPDPEELARIAAKRKDRKKKNKEGALGDSKSGASMKVPLDRKNLNNVRVIQRNLVYITNLALTAAKEEILRKHEYFGQYGKIQKVVVNKNNLYNVNSPGGPSVSAYVTYYRSQDALAAIKAVDGSWLNGRTLRASFGTTKYCTYFLKHVPCTNPDCMYLHELGGDADSFTKEEMALGSKAPTIAPSADINRRNTGLTQFRSTTTTAGTVAPTTTPRKGTGGPPPGMDGEEETEMDITRPLSKSAPSPWKTIPPPTTDWQIKANAGMPLASPPNYSSAAQSTHTRSATGAGERVSALPPTASWATPSKKSDGNPFFSSSPNAVSSISPSSSPPNYSSLFGTTPPEAAIARYILENSQERNFDMEDVDSEDVTEAVVWSDVKETKTEKSKHANGKDTSKATTPRGQDAKATKAKEASSSQTVESIKEIKSTNDKKNIQKEPSPKGKQNTKETENKKKPVDTKEIKEDLLPQPKGKAARKAQEKETTKEPETTDTQTKRPKKSNESEKEVQQKAQQAEKDKKGSVAKNIKEAAVPEKTSKAARAKELQAKQKQEQEEKAKEAREKEQEEKLKAKEAEKAKAKEREAKEKESREREAKEAREKEHEAKRKEKEAKERERAKEEKGKKEELEKAKQEQEKKEREAKESKRKAKSAAAAKLTVSAPTKPVSPRQGKSSQQAEPKDSKSATQGKPTASAKDVHAPAPQLLVETTKQKTHKQISTDEEQDVDDSWTQRSVGKPPGLTISTEAAPRSPHSVSPPGLGRYGSRHAVPTTPPPGLGPRPTWDAAYLSHESSEASEGELDDNLGEGFPPYRNYHEFDDFDEIDSSTLVASARPMYDENDDDDDDVGDIDADDELEEGQGKSHLANLGDEDEDGGVKDTWTNEQIDFDPWNALGLAELLVNDDDEPISRAGPLGKSVSPPPIAWPVHMQGMSNHGTSMWPVPGQPPRQPPGNAAPENGILERPDRADRAQNGSGARPGSPGRAATNLPVRATSRFGFAQQESADLQLEKDPAEMQFGADTHGVGRTGYPHGMLEPTAMNNQYAPPTIRRDHADLQNTLRALLPNVTISFDAPTPTPWQEPSSFSHPSHGPTGPTSVSLFNPSSPWGGMPYSSKPVHQTSPNVWSQPNPMPAQQPMQARGQHDLHRPQQRPPQIQNSRTTSAPTRTATHQPQPRQQTQQPTDPWRTGKALPDSAKIGAAQSKGNAVFHDPAIMGQGVAYDLRSPWALVEPSFSSFSLPPGSLLPTPNQVPSSNMMSAMGQQVPHRGFAQHP